MPYKTRPVIEMDFSDLGEDSEGKPFFVEIKNPKMLTYNERMEPAIAGKKTIGSDGKMIMTPENFAILGNYALTFVTKWNLESKIDETPLALDDPEVLNKIPGDIILAIQEKINAAPKDATQVKNS